MSSTRSRRRGATDRKDVEAEEEVLAEAAPLDRLREVLVRRREDAHVDVHHVLAADARDLAALQRAQHLRLRDEVHVADLVEEQRAAVRLLEEAALLRLGAGERAPLVAEELALDELARDGGAVHLHERAVHARREPVDGARDELLARSRSRPVMSTPAFVGATFSIRGRGAASAALRPIISYFSDCWRDTSASARLRVRRLEHVPHADEHALARRAASRRSRWPRA